MLVVEPVQAAIWHCLNHYAFGDATFLAERLLDESDSEESVFLAATCHYRAGRVNQAYHLLHSHGVRTAQTKFLLARCAADLKKDAEAEEVLLGPGAEVMKEVKIEDMVKLFGDRAAFALQILSSLYSRTERGARAADADRKVLKLNPLLWKSFESLCIAGETADPETVWDSTSLENLSHCIGTNPIMNLINTVSNNNNSQRPSAPTNPVPPPQDTPQHKQDAPQHKEHKSSLQPSFQTPTFVPPRPHITLNDSNLNTTGGLQQQQPVGGGLATPLLHYNSINSTPGLASSPPISGISNLNVTSDISTDCPIIPHHKLTSTMPPPLKPKAKPSLRGGPALPIRAFSPSFGTLSDTSSPAGFASKVLESSSPQVLILSPALPPSSPVLQSKAALVSTPVPQGVTTIPNPLRTSTPGVTLSQEIEPRPLKRVAMATKPDNTKPNVVLAPSQTMANMITPSPVSLPPRRSSRLFGSTQSVKENSKGLGKGRVKSKSRIHQNNRQLSENELNEKNRLSDGKADKDKISSILETELKPSKPQSVAVVGNGGVSLSTEAERMQRSSVKGLLNLLKQLGAAFQRVGQYDCKEAAKLLQQLPTRHANSAWVRAMLGKCYFEMNDYREACRYFSQVREQDPYRLELMEYYSTALWHLQEEVQLSALAQDLQRVDKFSASAWCAAGNCFSHQKEHESAIKFFQRAVQVSPNFAYAYTLLGHEYVLVEELEKALACFRTSVRLDRRHYNAWYGIGLTYYKQERFQLAEIYFRKALAINPYSPVLMCHVAVVQHATNNSTAALDTLNTAIKIAPKNALCKFQRASILHSCDRNKEALTELLQLAEIVPKESPVYFLMGKVHNKLNNTHLALMHFSWAMDLDPKGANSQVKDALDPALNRAGQELGLSVEEEQPGGAERVEPMVAEPDHHQDFQGELPQGLQAPGPGLNSSLQPGPGEPSGVIRQTGGGQDSDDSL